MIELRRGPHPSALWAATFPKGEGSFSCECPERAAQTICCTLDKANPDKQQTPDCKSKRAQYLLSLSFAVTAPGQFAARLSFPHCGRRAAHLAKYIACTRLRRPGK